MVFLRAFLLCFALVAAGLPSAETASDPGPEIHLWPLVQNETQQDGKHRTLVLFLYHRTTNPDGSPYSFNLFNWVEAPDFRAILPLWFEHGPEGQRHRMLVPFWFHGPGYTVVPPLLSAEWDRADGGSDTWLTPLVHIGFRGDGSLDDVFAGIYAQGDGYQVVFPAFYRIGSGEQTWSGLIPAWFSGPDWWCIPPALTARWRNDAGGSTTWVTPLVHRSTVADGSVASWHAGLLWNDGATTGVFPLAWWGGDSMAVLPAWLSGRDWWCIPPALTASWRNQAGGDTTWVTPLIHRSTAGDGTVASWHAGPVWSDGGTTGVFPLAWWGGGSTAVLPVWLSGDGWWCAPLGLSGGSTRLGGGRTDWITPLYHRTSDGLGGYSMHLGPWLSGRSGESGYEAVFPLWLHRWEGERVQDVLLPLWYHDPETTVVPPFLSARWTGADGSTSTWITPLAHWRTRADGSLADQHLLVCFRGNTRDETGSTDWNAIAPLWYYADREEGGVHRTWSGLIPLWFSAPGGWAVPPALTWQSHDDDDGGTTTWITPLYHHSTDANGATTSRHLLTWFSWPDRDVVLPLFYRSGPPGAISTGVIPFWFSDPEGWTIPPLLSWQRQREGGGTSTWITPLFHRASDGAGTYDMHAGPWLSGRQGDSGYEAVLPLWYRRWQGDQVENGLIPLWFSGPDFTVIPPALTLRWTGADGDTSTWVTPLAHWRTRADGSLVDRHVLTWFQGNARDEKGSTDWSVLAPFWYHAERQEGGTSRAWSGLIPLWFDGPGGWVVPPALTWQRRQEDGATSTWITPLYHHDTDAAGATVSRHLLNWFSWPDHDLVLPFWYRFGPPGARSTGVIPLWFDDPAGWSVPLACTWHRQREGGGTSTWVTPLFHRDTDATGTTSSMHVLNWLEGRDWQAVLPIAWWARDGSAVNVVPAWFSGATWWSVPLALSAGWQQGNGRRIDWFTPLCHVERDPAGTIDAWHVLNWIHTPTENVILPLAWWGGTEGDRHAAVLPLWLGGSTYDIVPPLLSARWQRDGGGHTTWITPLCHVDSDPDGQVNDWHLLNWFHDHDDDVVFPLAWLSGPAEARHRTIIPFWFEGPNHLVVPPWYQVRHDDGTVSRGLVPLWFASADWWFSPPALSGAWTGDDGHRTVLATPLFHHTTDAQGNFLHQHLLNWISAPDFDSVLPLYWSWRGDDGARRNLLAPLWYHSRNPDGTGTTAVLPPLFAYRSTRTLDISLPFQFIPFGVQSADDGHEVNILWRLFHRRRLGESTEYMIGPLWWSEHRPDAPAQWQILGGLVGRDTDLRSRTSRAYALWGLLPFGRSPFPGDTR